MKKETWKDVVGYEGFYQISNHGRIKSLARSGSGTFIKNDKFLVPTINNGKYIRKQLNKNGVGRCFFVHLLVAKAFIHNPENKPEINHKDGNKLNNHYSNLEWCTRQENMDHAMRTGLINMFGSNTNFAKFTDEQVLKIRKDFDGKTDTIHLIAQENKVCYNTIYKIVTRKSYYNI